jgi:hypothetical protein
VAGPKGTIDYTPIKAKEEAASERMDMVPPLEIVRESIIRLSACQWAGSRLGGFFEPPQPLSVMPLPSHDEALARRHQTRSTGLHPRSVSQSGNPVHD